MARNVSLIKYYLSAHLWLHHRCDRLSMKQRRLIVYGLSLVYFICSCVMIAQFFLPHGKEELAIPKGKMMGKIIDSPICTDSLHKRIINFKHNNSNEFGQ